MTSRDKWLIVAAAGSFLLAGFWLAFLIGRGKIGADQIADQSQQDQNASQSAVVATIPLAPGFNLISIPYQNPTGLRASEILANLTSRQAFRLQHGPERVWEDVFKQATSDQSAPGKGYFVKPDGQTTLEIAGNLTKQPLEKVILPLVKGWQAIGNPFEKPLPVNNISVRLSDGALLPYSNAITKNYVSELIKYDPVSQDWRALASTDTLSQFTGLVVQSGSDLELVFEPPD